MHINSISSRQNISKSYTPDFKAIRGVEYLGTFNPGIKPVDLEVLKVMQESKPISKFCQKYNVVIYLSKDCSLGEYTSILTFRYKNIAKTLKERLKNMLTPTNELNLIYRSKESSADHSQKFKEMIQNLEYTDLESMSQSAAKNL